MPALPFTAIRFALASLLLWLVLRLTEGPAALPRRRRPPAGGARGWWETPATSSSSSSDWPTPRATNSSLILATVPTVVAVFAGLLGLERITPRMWCGIALGTLGVGARHRDQRRRVLRGHAPGRPADGAGGAVLGRRTPWAFGPCPPGFSPLRVTTVTTIAGMPGLVLAGCPGCSGMRVGRGARRPHGRRSAYATVLSLVVAYLLWNRSVQAVGGTRTAIYMCVTPLVAVGAAWVHARASTPGRCRRSARC